MPSEKGLSSKSAAVTGRPAVWGTDFTHSVEERYSEEGVVLLWARCGQGKEARATVTTMHNAAICDAARRCAADRLRPSIWGEPRWLERDGSPAPRKKASCVRMFSIIHSCNRKESMKGIQVTSCGNMQCKFLVVADSQWPALALP